MFSESDSPSQVELETAVLTTDTMDDELLSVAKSWPALFHIGMLSDVRAAASEDISMQQELDQKAASLIPHPIKKASLALMRFFRSQPLPWISLGLTRELHFRFK